MILISNISFQVDLDGQKASGIDFSSIRHNHNHESTDSLD